MKKIPIILNCDTRNEIDDQFAITYALKSEDVEVLGIVSVQNQKRNGTNSVDLYHEEAKKLADLCQCQTPVFKGSRFPLHSKYMAEKSKGVGFIIDTIQTSRESVYLVCTGPATDIVSAALLDPTIKDKCKVIWLGAFKDQTEVDRTRNREVNFSGDKKAAGLIFHLGLDLTYLPMWGVADNLVTQAWTFADELRERNLPVTVYLAELIENHWKRFPIVHNAVPKTVKRFWVFSDIAAVAVAQNLGIQEQKEICAPEVRHGRFHLPSEGNTKVNMITSIDGHRIMQQAKERILA